MELSLAKVLENHANDAREFPDMRDRIRRHIVETQEHADRVVQSLRLLGEKPSAAKAMMGDVMGVVQGMSTGMFNDELVKNALADFASENFEIACYRSLIAAATELGYTEIVSLCEENLRDEQDMAIWLEEQIPEVTRMHLQKEAVGH
jgi:ferritin-like metal-binding protein YciE